MGNKKYGSIKNRNDYERIIEIARKEVGVREVGAENFGPRVRVYLDCVGFKEAAPWCAAWVSFIFKEAGFSLPRTAWSPALFPSARSAKVAAKGLVFGIHFPSLGRIAHCGVIEGLKGDLVQAIEGNTSIAGSREGDGVYRRLRHKRTISKYADWL